MGCRFAGSWLARPAGLAICHFCDTSKNGKADWLSRIVARKAVRR